MFVQVEYDFQYFKMEMPADVPVLVVSQVTGTVLSKLAKKKVATIPAQTVTY